MPNLDPNGAKTCPESVGNLAFFLPAVTL